MRLSGKKDYVLGTFRPDVFEDNDFVSHASSETDINCIYWFAPEGEREKGQAKIEVNIPNNERIDRDNVLIHTVGFTDSVVQSSIPRPILHRIMKAATSRIRLIPPQE